MSDDEDRGDTRLLTGEELVELLLSVSPVQDGGLTTVGMVGGWIIICPAIVLCTRVIKVVFSVCIYSC